MIRLEKIRFNRELYQPLIDTVKYQPDLIMMRHVIEHLTAPSSFLHSLSWGSSQYQKKTYLYCEVPCIDRALATGRLADFYYEHPSQFTTTSFTRMLATAGEVINIMHAYDGEVICGLVDLAPSLEQSTISHTADCFFSSTSTSINRITRELKTLVSEGQSIAIWGGTGKCASFMHHYQISSEDIPLVVDSDKRKWGTFVPGVGQEIKSPAFLVNHPINTLIIPTQWRSLDILIEANSLGLLFDKVLMSMKAR